VQSNRLAEHASPSADRIRSHSDDAPIGQRASGAKNLVDPTRRHLLRSLWEAHVRAVLPVDRDIKRACRPRRNRALRRQPAREQSRACTVNRELAFLKRVFNVAIASGLADRNR
jgi:hypothetical protein